MITVMHVDMETALETTRLLLATFGDPSKHPLTLRWVRACQQFGSFRAADWDGKGRWVLQQGV